MRIKAQNMNFNFWFLKRPNENISSAQENAYLPLKIPETQLNMKKKLTLSRMSSAHEVVKQWRCVGEAL